MRKAQVIVVLTFLALFGAGAVSALLAKQWTDARPERRPGGPGGYLPQLLNLTPEQQTKMREIWSGAREQMQAADRDKRRELSRQRDDEVRKLLTDDQRKQFDEILANHERKLKELREAAEAAMKQAEQKTREMLTDEQRAKYDEWQKQRSKESDGREGRGGDGRGGEGRGPRPIGPPGGGEPMPPNGPHGTPPQPR